eukprot:4055756-Prymnesium_polylepis.1
MERGGGWGGHIPAHLTTHHDTPPRTERNDTRPRAPPPLRTLRGDAQCLTECRRFRDTVVVAPLSGGRYGIPGPTRLKAAGCPPPCLTHRHQVELFTNPRGIRP